MQRRTAGDFAILEFPVQDVKQALESVKNGSFCRFCP
jgi:hypothetical protein